MARCQLQQIDTLNYHSHPHSLTQTKQNCLPIMELTFVTELGQTFVVEIDPNMQLEDVMALLEAEVRSLLPPLVLLCATPDFHG